MLDLIHMLEPLDLSWANARFLNRSCWTRHRSSLKGLQTLLPWKCGQFLSFKTCSWISNPVPTLIAGLRPVVMTGKVSNPSAIQVVPLESISSVCIHWANLHVKANALLGGDVQKVMLGLDRSHHCPHTVGSLIILHTRGHSFKCVFANGFASLSLQSPCSLISGVTVWSALHVLTETSDSSLAMVSLPQASTCQATSNSPGTNLYLSADTYCLGRVLIHVLASHMTWIMVPSSTKICYGMGSGVSWLPIEQPVCTSGVNVVGDHLLWSS